MNEKLLRKILVAIDLSSPSRYAWHQAGDFASVTGAGLTAAHVLPSSFQSGAERKRAALRRLREELGPASRVHVATGDAADVLLRLARDLKPDLLAMGTHGRAGIRRLFLGSVAETVVRRSPVPVLTVRDVARPINSILVPVNLTHYAVTGIAHAARFAQALDASLTLLHVAGASSVGADPEKTLDAFVRRLPSGLRSRCRTLVQSSRADPAEAILSNAESHDLISLVAHRRKPLRDAILGTTAERVLRRSPVPVLSLPYASADTPERRRLLGDTFSRYRT